MLARIWYLGSVRKGLRGRDFSHLDRHRYSDDGFCHCVIRLQWEPILYRGWEIFTKDKRMNRTAKDQKLCRAVLFWPIIGYL